jgi:glycosyltransferase involved in cell wall biosynthesis
MIPSPSAPIAPAIDKSLLAAGISVFFPAFNDAPSIPALVRNAHRLLDSLTAEFEIIVVNDGSSDPTPQVLQSLHQELGPRLRIVTHPVNLGYGAALRSGFAAARYPWVFYTDGDGQYDVTELLHLLPHATDGVGLVNGYKLRRHDPAHRIWIGQAYNQFVRRLFGIQIRDVDCDFRLLRRDILPPADLRASGGTICLEIALLAESSRLAIREAPVHHYPRIHGRSQFFRLAPLCRTFHELIRLYLGRIVSPALRNLKPKPLLPPSASRPAEGD